MKRERNILPLQNDNTAEQRQDKKKKSNQGGGWSWVSPWTAYKILRYKMVFKSLLDRYVS